MGRLTASFPGAIAHLTPNNGDVLGYNAYSREWEPQEPGSLIVQSILQHIDVDDTISPTDGDILVYKVLPGGEHKFVFLHCPNIISDMEDVSDTEPTEGQVLTWNATDEIWEPQTPAWAVRYLDDLLDVTATSPTANQILMFNGTEWVNADPPNFEHNLEFHEDVEITDPQDNQRLIYNGYNWVNAYDSASVDIASSADKWIKFQKKDGQWGFYSENTEWTPFKLPLSGTKVITTEGVHPTESYEFVDVQIGGFSHKSYEKRFKSETYTSVRTSADGRTYIVIPNYLDPNYYGDVYTYTWRSTQYDDVSFLDVYLWDEDHVDYSVSYETQNLFPNYLVSDGNLSTEISCTFKLISDSNPGTRIGGPGQGIAIEISGRAPDSRKAKLVSVTHYTAED